jgi:hypothetical protein
MPVEVCDITPPFAQGELQKDFVLTCYSRFDFAPLSEEYL